VSINGATNLENFSTDAFAKISEDMMARVYIENCNLTSTQSANHPVTLSSFTMKNVVIGELTSSSFFNLKARR
jgi:hypothetical protein